MFAENDLRELLEFKATGPTLSVYLNMDPSEGNADAYRLRLRNMLKEVDLPKDVEAVENYFTTQYNWSGRSVAVFSCAADGFFRAYPFAIPVADMIQVGIRPSVKPLADLWDNYGGYGVVLVDKQGARLFHFHLGELREQEGTVGEIVRHTKRGGASAFPGRRGGTAGQTRYADEVVERNMKEAAEFAARFFEENRVRRILIGGTDDNVAMFRTLLPKAWQSLVVGAFPVSMTASHAEVLNKAMQVGQETEHKREAHLVDALITSAAKGGQAVVGLEKTLAAVNEDRVQLLLVAKGFRQAGYRCVDCSLLTAENDNACDACDGQRETVPDIVELAVGNVLLSGGDVEVIQDNAELAQAGNIGGMLRY